MFVSPKRAYSLTRPDPLKFDRRRECLNRGATAMFAVTVANFLLFTLCIGTEVAALVVYIRKALTLDIDYPFEEKQDSINNAFQNMNLVMLWSGGLLVSIKPSLPDLVSIHVRCR